MSRCDWCSDTSGTKGVKVTLDESQGGSIAAEVSYDDSMLSAMLLLIDAEHESLLWIQWVKTSLSKIIHNCCNTHLINCFLKTLGKTFLLIFARGLDAFHKFFAVVHRFFKDLNTETSNGCRRWVEFGSRATSRIRFSLQNSAISKERCNLCPSA